LFDAIINKNAQKLNTGITIGGAFQPATSIKLPTTQPQQPQQNIFTPPTQPKTQGR